MKGSVSAGENQLSGFAFLLRVGGLAFFLVTRLVALLLVSKEKVKSGPMATEKLKT